ncbi:MAG: PAS domain S-box protein [Chloroflexota bacterium]
MSNENPMGHLNANPVLATRIQTLSRRAALLVTVVGSLVIAGWLFDIEIFKTVLPGLVAMKFNTALGFMLAGTGLLSLRRRPDITQAAALLILLLGLLTLCEYVFGWDLRIDQGVVPDLLTPLNNYPGRMSPVTAFNFCLVGSSLLLITQSRRFALAHLLTLVAVFTALLSLTGYIYGVQSLYKMGLFTSIALHTTITFIIFGLGFIFADPERGLTAALVADRAGSLLLRRLLPATIVVSFALAWLQQRGQQVGLYDINFGLALFAMSNIVIFALLIFWSAYSLNRVDRIRAEQETQRQQADEARKRYAQRLLMLHDIDMGILQANSIPTVLESTLKHLRQLIPCQRADVVIIEETTGEALIFALGLDDDTKLSQGVRVPVPLNIFEGYDSNNIRLFEDIRLWQDTWPQARQLVNEGSLSALSALLMDREHPIGTFGLFAATPNFFTAEHQEILSEVASQIAIVINQLRLFEALAQRSAELEQNVVDLQQAEAALRQVNEQLELRVLERTNELTQANSALEAQIVQRKSAEERFRALLESAPDAVIIAKPDGEIILINAQTERLFGYTRDELLGEFIERFIPEPFRNRHPAHITEYVANPQVRMMGAGLELYGLRKDGSQFPVEISLSPITTDDGIVIARSVREITARKQAEDALRENEEKLRTIFNLLPVGMSLINNERQIIEMNPAQEKILGMTLDDIMTGRYLARQYLHGDGSPVLAGEFPSSRAMAEQRAIFDAEIGFVKEDGTTVWTTVSAAPLPGNQGLVMVMADMTERKYIEQAMQRLQAAFDIVTEGAQMISFDWHYLYLNASAARRGHRTPVEMQGHTMMEIYPGIEQTPLFDVLQRCMDQRVSEQFENQFTFPDNTVGWFDLRIQPVPEGLFILSTDVTERKRAGEVIKNNERLLHTILDNLPVGVWMTDAAGTITQANPASREIWGGMKYVGIVDYGETKGWWIDTGERIQAEDWAAVRAITQGETVLNDEVEIECLDGSHKFILNSAIPMRDDQLNITGAIIVNQDVTKIKRAEIVLQKTNEDLQLANEEIQRFAYIVSHDLRAPLINLKGFSELLRKSIAQIDQVSESILPLLDEAQKQVFNTALRDKIPTALRFINTSVDRMDGFTSAILKLSRIGHHQVSYENVSVNDLVNSVLQSLAGQIADQGIEVTVEDLPEVRADRTALDQILGNVITNAIKYLDPQRPGQIRIYADSTQENTTIHVQDNGRGIAEIDYEKIFAPFRRAGRQTVEGEGMGLAYVQALLKLHHGRIWFTSKPDVGSTFSFTIPRLSEVQNDSL